MESESTQTGEVLFNLEAALAVWRRRKWPVLLVFVAVLSIALPVIRNLPKVYQSTATVLVEHPLIPVDVLGTPASGELETRLRSVSEQILSRARLIDLVTRFNLYPDLRSAPELAVEQMRRDIQIQFNGVPQPTGMSATIELTVSYQGRDPLTVAQVTNALTALYVAENTKAGMQKTTGASEFLQAQLNDARRQMEARQQQLIAFQERHIGELPEQQATNLAMLGRLNDQLRAITNQEGDLSNQAVGLSGTGSDTGLARLSRLKGELADLRTRYTDEHPGVVRVKTEIANLEHQLATRSGGPAVPDPAVAQPASPDASENGSAPLRAEEQALRSRIALLEQRIESAPLIQQELQRLSQDYSAAQVNYQSLQQRFEGAQLAEEMDQRLQGEQFRILDPAVPSHRPVKPHRSQLLLAALFLSMGAGVVTGLLAEAGDTSFHTVDGLRAFTSTPVLGNIPLIVTEGDARGRRRRFRLAVLGAIVGIALLAGGAFYLTRPGHALVAFLMAVYF